MKMMPMPSKAQFNSIDSFNSPSSTRRRTREVNEDIKKEMIMKLATAFLTTDKGECVINSYRLLTRETENKEQKTPKLCQTPLKLISIKPYRLIRPFKSKIKQKHLSMFSFLNADISEAVLYRDRKQRLVKKRILNSQQGFVMNRTAKYR